ncbi:MAG: restriction endonuclease [Ruminococcaceae bacterium]|nr:restriction endonuclease [Oscillospiraceae bacterium]
MKNIQDYRKIYVSILDMLEKSPADRQTLIKGAIDTFELSKKELSDNRTNGRLNVLRSMCGTVINEMHNRAIISRDANFLYHKKTEKPIAIRMERCEEEILRMLRESPKTRAEIKDSLVQFFGTDSTPTPSDDNKLFTFMGQILKALVNEGLIEFDGSIYRILPAKAAKVKSREEILTLKADFLSLIHSKGGEFFEHYFMNLLSKYLIRSGKTVIESYVTGGSADGGIDGIAKTVDSLGFKETIMVQTKNRIEVTVETDIRAFYGAVCAAQGSRGIFATTSDFHPMAKKLLESIDNCVGINGDKIFTMAADSAYGLKRVGKRLIIDAEVFE